MSTFNDSNDEKIEFKIPAQLTKSLRYASRVAVLTGAGISAESGLATFRDPLTGLWSNYKPQELGTPEAFERNPRLVWEWFAWRREKVEQAQPNPGHRALATLARLVPRLTLITQNVDGLHQAAGSPEVIELHGNIRRVKCSVDNQVVESWPATEEVPPRCPRCGGLLRPDVVWFGEMLPQENLALAVEAARHCDVFLSIGTSGTVEPAASLPRLAKNRGAMVLTINLEVTPRASFKIYDFKAKAGRFLPALLRQTWPDQEI